MTNAEPSKTCDVVLKGGITSGVVYPLALASLAEEYRFANIGGTSAGAIAAAAAAAAEYGRPVAKAGFARLERIPDEIGPRLLSMFQPSPRLRPLYAMFLAALKGKGTSGVSLAVLGALVRGYPGRAAAGALVGIVVAVIGGFAGSWGFVAFGLLLTLVGVVAALAMRLLTAVTVELPRNDFGLCPGIRQEAKALEGFTDYLTRLVDEASGRPADAPPLTFGDLAAPPGGRPPINLVMMTTSLMEKRPYTLPMADPDGRDEHRFVFEVGEWSRLFPARVMKHLTSVCVPFQPTEGEAGTFYHLPKAKHLPVVVAARMSLSFPLLISAVPLYARDFTLVEVERQKLRRCLFSDGGLSSNFPIHFFDHLLPNAPTFAITLDAFDEHRNHDGNVWLPDTAKSGIQQPIVPFSGLGGFLSRLLDAAKDWQDSLQSTLPGYRERIVHIALKPDEGGLNLAMTPETIAKLVGYGKQAGDMLRQRFDLDAHRWRRFLVAGARIEETANEVADAYDATPGSGPAYPAFLAGYASHPKEYAQTGPVLDAMLARMGDLARLGTTWRVPKGFRDGKIPKPRTALRITPKP